MELIGAFAIVLGLSGFVWKDPRIVLRLAAAASFVWIIYFLTLSAWAPAISTFFGMIRFISGAFAPKRMMWGIVIATTLISTPIIYYSTPNWLGVLVIFGSALKGFSVVMRDYPVAFRIVFCASEICYFCFGFVLSAISTMIWSVLSTAMAFGTALIIKAGAKLRSGLVSARV